MIKELKENKSILHNRHIKVTILTVLPLVIGCLGSAMGQWNVSEDAWFYPKLVCLVALSIIEIAALWKYTSWDKESQDNTASLQKAFNELDLRPTCVRRIIPKSPAVFSSAEVL